MGSMRLAAVFGFGLVGVFYLIVALTPLINGTLELKPTGLDIDTIESEGFPEAEYLEILDGHIVFDQASLHFRGLDDSEFARLTAPVVSESLLSAWQESADQGAPPDATRCRLLVSFEADQVAELWPELDENVREGKPLDLPPLQMVLTGETIPAKHMVIKPYDFVERTTGFDWDQARWLRYERHFNSAGRFVKNLLIGNAHAP